MAYLQAKRLHERRVVFSDGEFERATLLPFFQRDGTVERILIIDLHGGEAHVLRFSSDRGERLVQVPFFKKHLVLHVRIADLIALNYNEASELGDMWHFDPWWLLAEPPFNTQRTTPILKPTNCAHLFEMTDPHLTFRRDLSRVKWLLDGSKGDSNGKQWSPELLPEHHPEVTQAPGVKQRTRWVLDPPWQASAS